MKLLDKMVSMRNIHQKLLALIFTFLFLTISFLNPITTSAQTDTGWVIDSFHSDIIINQDTSIDITETLQVDFKGLQKHGIFRDIPVKYQTRLGNNLDIRFKLIEVTDLQGNSIAVKTTRSGKNINLKIGDANATISGQQTYVISYQVSRVITAPNEQAELYWNVTGNSWPVIINQASATVSGPPGSVVDTICFTGYFGATQADCTHSSDANTANFTALNLSPGQGLTISTTLDQQLLTFPSTLKKIFLFLADNLVYFIPLGVLIYMFRLYWTRGRDRQYQNMFSEEEGSEVVPLFQKISAMNIYGPPKNLSPGEVGVIVDEKVHLRDITAIAIDLARRGFFTIKEIPKKGLFTKTDFELKLTNKKDTHLKEFETEILDMLFGASRKKTIKLSKPEAKAYKHLDQATTALYKHLHSEGYFSGDPKKIRSVYLVVGVIVAFFGSFAFLPFAGLINPLSGMFAAIISGIIIIIFSFFMPARTAKGRKALKQVVGLKEWIRIGAWREQIHEKHNFLEEVLPYTIAFGLTHKFIQAFKKSDLQNLSWYQSTNPITMTNFSHSMGSFTSKMSTGVAGTRPKSASSGGSGFSGGSSGGGFGGGGGGSW